MARIVKGPKGGDVIEKDHFRYRLNSSNLSKTHKYWRCELHEICPGRLITNYDTEDGIEILKEVNHTHVEDPVQTKVQEVLRSVKRRAETHPNEPPKSIYRKTVDALDDMEVMMNLPERKNMLQSISRYQNKVLKEQSQESEGDSTD